MVYMMGTKSLRYIRQFWPPRSRYTLSLKVVRWAIRTPYYPLLWQGWGLDGREGQNQGGWFAVLLDLDVNHQETRVGVVLERSFASPKGTKNLEVGSQGLTYCNTCKCSCVTSLHSRTSVWLSQTYHVYFQLIFSCSSMEDPLIGQNLNSLYIIFKHP